MLAQLTKLTGTMANATSGRAKFTIECTLPKTTGKSPSPMH